MYPAKRAEEIAHRGPHAFSGIDVYLANAIPVIITSPFMFAVADSGMRANDVVVAQPFVGIDLNAGQCERMDVMFEGFLVGVMNHPQTNVATLATNRPHNWRTIIVIGAMAALFVGPTSGRIIRIGMILTFFPPHSGTFRLFQSVHRTMALGVDDVLHWYAIPCERRVPFDG